MSIELPAVRFQTSYPRVIDSMSVSRAQNRLVALVETADPFWQIEMRTAPLRARDRMKVEAFRDACRGGMVTVHYRPRHMCLPQSLWGNPTSELLADGVLAAASGYGVTIEATDGLVLTPGDLVGFSDDAFNWMARVQEGGTVSGGDVDLVLNMPVPSFVEPGATVRFQNPILNTRMLPGSFDMPDTGLPVATFTLVEVPR